MGASGLKLGLLGGTFNPIHLAHLRVAEEAAELLGLDRVMFVPVAWPPHKDSAPVVSFEHRFNMVELAIAGRPGFAASNMEGRRGGRSYTVDTLKQIQRELGPEIELFFLTGMDSFLEVHTWRNYIRMFELASLVVTTRPGFDPGLLAIYLKETIDGAYAWDPEKKRYDSGLYRPVYFLDIARLDISSSGIRNLISLGRSIRYLAPEPVREYILTHDLYKDVGR